MCIGTAAKIVKMADLPGSVNMLQCFDMQWCWCLSVLLASVSPTPAFSAEGPHDMLLRPVEKQVQQHCWACWQLHWMPC